MKLLRFTLSLICLYAFSFDALAGKTNMGLKEALKKNLVTIKAIGAGGAIGKCLALNVQNNTNAEMNITVDDALIFTPADDRYQKLVTAGGELLALGAKKEQSLLVQTFCGNRPAHCPKANLAYRFEKQGSKEMCEVVKYIREHKLYDYMGQSAVWMFTNQHPFTAVYNSYRPDQSKLFMEHISKVTKRPIPQYHLKYKKPVDTTGSTFNTELEEGYVDISWNFSTQRNLHIGIFKENGQFFKSVTDPEVISASGHRVLVKFRPATYKKGTYLVRLYDDDNNVYIQKSFVIGNDHLF